MMRLYVLGSGSRGNCCAVEADGAAMLLDAGFSAREIERRAETVGLDLARVAGDRAHPRARRPRLRRAAPGPAARRAGADGGRDVGPAGGGHGRRRATADRVSARPSSSGPFRIEACPTSHDAAEPLALAVRTADGTGVGVAYDLGRPTAAVRYLLRNLTALVLEANHDEVAAPHQRLPAGGAAPDRGLGRPLSNRAAAELLVELHHPGLAVVVLAHLSQRCNTADDARAAVAPALRRVGFRGDAARRRARTRRCRRSTW